VNATEREDTKNGKISSDSMPSIDPSNGDGSTTLDPANSADNHEEDQEGVVGRFQVPFRPHLFTKSRAPKLRIKGAALVEDEVFLILVFIYSEAKRQDKTVCHH
jgi:hypothetical protein